MKRGLALIVVVGILGVLAVLAAAFVMMAQLERRASMQRMNAARAYLLARSGIENALARLELGQDSSYGGENWDADPAGTLSAFEAAQEVHHRTGAGTEADVEGCPVRHAMRPSFFARLTPGSPEAALVTVEGRKRGYSGTLAGDEAPLGNGYALKVQSANAGIFINGGALDDKDRDPDGSGAKPGDFLLNPGAAAEVALLLPNKIPDHRDVSMEGPNGFLVRLLNNLDAVVTKGASAKLGEEVVGARPVGGYKSLEELKPVLGQARFDRFKPYLTLRAWVDPKVVKPQPMDGRPAHWQDIDDAHRIGTEAEEISGVRNSVGVGEDGKVLVAGNIMLNAGITGNGKEEDAKKGDAPWQQTITVMNQYEGNKTYPVSWERDFVYAWSQLRLSPPSLEPRAPLSVNTAPEVVLASVFLGLKGTHLEVWDGAAGWEGGFGWFDRGDGRVDPGYSYPDQATEETPWIRTRLDYGMTYGTSQRPWYGPKNYEPHAGPQGGGGKPVIQSAPLGRLKETPAITQAQALGVAQQVRQALSDLGPARTWQQVNAFVGLLPRWEDVDEDGILDGAPYRVEGSGETYTRRMYKREDANGDSILQRETFTPLHGTSWKAGNIAWLDPHLGKAQLPAASLVPGLTFIQKDVLKAMANPNTDLNDFNPDGNLWKEVDKTDLSGIQAKPSSYVHTTELSFEGMGPSRVSGIGRVLGPSGRLLAQKGISLTMEGTGKIYRDTTQADFMRAYNPGEGEVPLPPQAIFTGPPAPYLLAGGQPLLSYPEPQTVGAGLPAADATYDGQLSLGFIGAQPMPGVIETLRGDLFDTADALATADLAVPDLRGPYHEPLLRQTAPGEGQVFPDGVYSERDRTLKYPMAGNIVAGDRVDGKTAGTAGDGTYFYIACWAKSNWLPEASPRAHAWISLSRGHLPRGGTRPDGAYDVYHNSVPLDDIGVHPAGLYFVPARNNLWQDEPGTYDHSSGSTRGKGWASRSLLWGTTHNFIGSDALNRRGIEPPPATKPVGRLEGRRWQHLAGIGGVGAFVGRLANENNEGHPANNMALIIGRQRASKNDHGWGDRGFGGIACTAMAPHHDDGTENHIRFGEIAGEHNMNYTADATFACVRAGQGVWMSLMATLFTSAIGPAAMGRYYKEGGNYLDRSGATYDSPKMPAGIRPLRVTWTEIPCDLWFDENNDGWVGDPSFDPSVRIDGKEITNVPGGELIHFAGGFVGCGVMSTLENTQADIALPGGHLDAHYLPKNDRFGPTGTPGPNGLRDVHIEIEIWDDRGTPVPADDVMLARFDDPAADNRIPAPAPLLPVVDAGDLPVAGGLLQSAEGVLQNTPQGRLYYKAVFVNEWDATTRANYPLDVTPFLDDVTITYQEPGGPILLSWETGGEE